jgi:hypothetical protein
MSGPYFYARTDSVDCACRLRSITGVAHLVTSDGNASPKKALYVDQAFIDDMARKSKALRDARCAGLKRGSFVRIMDSEFRDFCGHVNKIEGDRAVVKVELLTKRMFINTPIRNLLNLSQVPLERRVFYYGGLVADMEDPTLLECDLHTWEPEENEEVQPEEQPRLVRYTATRFARELIAANHHLTPYEVAEKTLAELKTGKLRMPKNLFIVYGIIKTEWLNAHKQYKNWRMVSRMSDKKLTAAVVGFLGKNFGVELPLYTPDSRIAQDGRQRRRKVKGGTST